MTVYNRSEIEMGTRATAEQVNAEFIKIQAAIAGLQSQLDGVVAGTPLASYTHVAFADSADGSANFTTGEPGGRAYIGIAYNRPSPSESIIPSDYQWTRYRGADGEPGTDGDPGGNGSDGTDGNYVDFRFVRADAQPATPIGVNPAGWSTTVPVGDGFVWFSKATKTQAGGILTEWSVPAQMTLFGVPEPYDAGKTYSYGMTVLFNGGTYIVTAPTVAGSSPSGTNQANAAWDVIAAPGSAGEPAVPPSAFTSTIDLTASGSGVNLRTIADSAGFTGMSDATITFRVPSGVTISGGAGSGKAIDTGTWPTSSYTVTLTLIVQSGGKVYGGGGNGGKGGNGGGGGTGGAGGDAVYAREAITVTIDAGGEVKGGGGAGGGGAGTTTGFPEPVWNAGGGGGGGFPNGAAGGGGTGTYGNGSAGSAGTVVGGGAGGAGDGGAAGDNGGNAATAGAGAKGGAAGYAVRKNGFTVPVTNSGTMTGTAA